MTIVMPPGLVSCIGATKYPHCIALHCIAVPQRWRLYGRTATDGICYYQCGLHYSLRIIRRCGQCYTVVSIMHHSNCAALESVSRNTVPAPNIGLSGSWFVVKCVNASRLLHMRLLDAFYPPYSSPLLPRATG